MTKAAEVETILEIDATDLAKQDEGFRRFVALPEDERQIVLSAVSLAGFEEKTKRVYCYLAEMTARGKEKFTIPALFVYYLYDCKTEMSNFDRDVTRKHGEVNKEFKAFKNRDFQNGTFDVESDPTAERIGDLIRFHIPGCPGTVVTIGEKKSNSTRYYFITPTYARLLLSDKETDIGKQLNPFLWAVNDEVIRYFAGKSSMLDNKRKFGEINDLEFEQKKLELTKSNMETEFECKKLVLRYDLGCKTIVATQKVEQEVECNNIRQIGAAKKEVLVEAECEAAVHLVAAKRDLCEIKMAVDTLKGFDFSGEHDRKRNEVIMEKICQIKHFGGESITNKAAEEERLAEVRRAAEVEEERRRAAKKAADAEEKRLAGIQRAADAEKRRREAQEAQERKARQAAAPLKLFLEDVLAQPLKYQHCRVDYLKHEEHVGQDDLEGCYSRKHLYNAFKKNFPAQAAAIKMKRLTTYLNRRLPSTQCSSIRRYINGKQEYCMFFPRLEVARNEANNSSEYLD